MIIDKDFLSSSQKNFINNVVLNNKFPFYYNSFTVRKGDGLSMGSHVLIKRPEDRKPGEQFFNSDYTQTFMEMFSNFMIKHGLPYTTVLRASLNLTYYNGKIKSETHLDHTYDHKQLLIYLNDPIDKKASTVIIDNKKEIKIKPEQFKGVCWDFKKHYHYFPKKGSRVVVVFTYR